jgi:transposase
MIGLAPGTKVFLACQPIDLRAGFDGLAAKVQQIIGADPFSGQVFIFRGKRGHYLKGLYWDGSGLCLFAKRLERGLVAATARNTHASAREVETHRERHRQEALERVKAAFRARTRGSSDDGGSIG